MSILNENNIFGAANAEKIIIPSLLDTFSVTQKFENTNPTLQNVSNTNIKPVKINYPKRRTKKEEDSNSDSWISVDTMFNH